MVKASILISWKDKLFLVTITLILSKDFYNIKTSIERSVLRWRQALLWPFWENHVWFWPFLKEEDLLRTFFSLDFLFLLESLRRNQKKKRFVQAWATCQVSSKLESKFWSKSISLGHKSGHGTQIRTWDTNPDIFGQGDIFTLLSKKRFLLMKFFLYG